MRDRRTLTIAALALAMILIVAGAVYAVMRDREQPVRTVLWARAAEPVAMVALNDGGILYGERSSGKIFRLAPNGTKKLVATVALGPTAGDRGLRGLALEGDLLYASFASLEGQITVAVLPARPGLRWNGPRTANRRNGGRLVQWPDHGVVVAVGDQGALNSHSGKLERLLPDSRSEIVSTGWSNPVGLTVMPNGQLWVADDAGGNGADRLARADTPRPTSINLLSAGSAPAGLAAIGDNDLALCQAKSGHLDLYTVNRAGKAHRSRLIARGCTLGVVRLARNGLAFANSMGIFRIAN